MVKCNGFQNLLPLELEGQLKAALRQDFYAHMEQCPACRQDFEALQNVDAELSLLAKTPPLLDNTFEDRVMAEIEKKADSPAMRYFSFIFLACAISLCLASFAWLFSVSTGFSLSVFESLYGMALGAFHLLDVPVVNVLVVCYGIFAWIGAAYFLVYLFRKPASYSAS